jgi:hypothetical protein
MRDHFTKFDVLENRSACYACGCYEVDVAACRIAVFTEVSIVTFVVRHWLIMAGVYCDVYRSYLAIRGVLSLVQIFTLQPHTIV